MVVYRDAIKDRVAITSLLRSGRTLSTQRIDGIVNAALNKLAETALTDLGPGVRIAIRELLPGDAPGNSNNLWAETSGTAVGWATTTAWDGTAIADETFIVIWGIRAATPAANETAATTFQAYVPPISALRVTIGATLVSQWSLYGIVPVHVTDLSGDAGYDPYEGYLEVPIVITQNQTVKIEEYSTTTAGDPYEVWYLGAVAEKVGKTLNPS